MKTESNWVVICDDDRWYFRTLALARECARWVRRRPSNVDIRGRGYKNVDGCVRVMSLDAFAAEAEAVES